MNWNCLQSDHFMNGIVCCRYPDANQVSGTKNSSQELPSIIALTKQYIDFRDVIWRNALERLKLIMKKKDERFCWTSLVCIIMVRKRLRNFMRSRRRKKILKKTAIFFFAFRSHYKRFRKRVPSPVI